MALLHYQYRFFNEFHYEFGSGSNFTLEWKIRVYAQHVKLYNIQIKNVQI